MGKRSRANPTPARLTTNARANSPKAAFPVLPVLTGAVLLVIALALGAVLILNTQTTGASPIASIPCEANEQVAVHYHAHLEILNEGAHVTIPEAIGIRANSCLYWLHTHTDNGEIHVEAPAAQKDRVFTVGDFFKVWGQPLTSTRVATITLRPDQKLLVFVDGQRYDADPAKIPLKSLRKIVIEITPPEVAPPAYTFEESA